MWAVSQPAVGKGGHEGEVICHLGSKVGRARNLLRMNS